jgi:hypothetical protein
MRQRTSGKAASGLARVRKVAVALPEVEEGTSYGTAAFKVKGKLLARMKEDGTTLVVRVALELKEALIADDPDVFFTTSHYDGYPAVLVRLEKIDARGLARVMDEAWRFVAPKTLVKARDAKA